MNMKKWLIVLLCLLAVAAVAAFVTVSVQKSGVENEVKALNEQIADLKTQMDTAAKNAAQELESVKAAAATAAEEAAAVATAAATAADQELERVKAEAETAAQSAAEALEQTKTALQAAEEKAANTEAELTGMRRKNEELTAAKEAAEGEARQAKEQLNSILAAVTGILNGSAKEENVPIAMIMYENADHTVRAYGQEFTDGVTASMKDVQGEGEYTVGLTFDTPAEGLYFLTLCIENGEIKNPGWVIDVKEVKVNGEAIELGGNYTTSDDGRRTRVNLFNEWVTGLPEDARALAEDLADASAVPVNPEDFSAVESVVITFEYLSPETVSARRAEN